jgi:hypothetical protein
MISKPETLPRLANRKTDTPFDRIWKHIFTPKKRVELKAKDLALKERWEYMWKLICGDVLTDRQAILAHLQRYPDIDESTAYRDLADAKKLFGDARNGTKAQRRAIANEWITELLNKAKEKEDFTAAEKLVQRYIQLHGLDSEDSDALAKLLKKQRPAMIVFTTDPKELERQKKELEREAGRTLDVDHEEID